ncbi:response regulator transcription factor [Chitinimonas lacunae]|uniref:Response regulator transcription factor n=1 Tax=Chitinimonas lacunae TaxID=1963018 RepID=A0ABV8MRX5_9NEIS
MKLFLAEDDAVLSDALIASLMRSGYTVDHRADGFEAEAMLTRNDYDAVILDLGLPGQDGLTVLRRVRAAKPGLPILILTALDGIDDRVAGLDAGADDYLAKPFEFVELEARLKALLRRSRALPPDQPSLGRLRLDRGGQRAWAGDTPLELSARELAVLDILLSQRDRVVTKEQIAAEIGGEDLGANAIEVYVHRIRKKIEPSGVNIRTLRGLGYLIEKQATEH